jgi:Protein of unknown function (DUF3099)
MPGRGAATRVTDVPPGFSDRLRTRQRWYFTLMGICIVLILLAWNVVRFFSTDLAIVMSLIAAPLPPVAVLVANWREDH